MISSLGNEDGSLQTLERMNSLDDCMKAKPRGNATENARVAHN
jgi:hypothetical protein